MKAKSNFSLKDQLFNADKVAYLSGLISEDFPEFDQPNFQRDVVVAFSKLELKERIAYISSCLHDYLPKDYPATVQKWLNHWFPITLSFWILKW